MASGHVIAQTGPTHGHTDQFCIREESPYQLGAVHTRGYIQPAVIAQAIRAIWASAMAATSVGRRAKSNASFLCIGLYATLKPTKTRRQLLEDQYVTALELTTAPTSMALTWWRSRPRHQKWTFRVATRIKLRNGAKVA
jgi:hypothetical protein